MRPLPLCVCTTTLRLRYRPTRPLSLYPSVISLSLVSLFDRLSTTDPARYPKPSNSIDTASVARQIYLHKGTGVGTLRKIHGGAKRRGCLGSKHAAGSGSVVRKAVQALEKIKVLEKDDKGCVRICGLHVDVNSYLFPAVYLYLSVHALIRVTIYPFLAVYLYPPPIHLSR